MICLFFGYNLNTGVYHVIRKYRVLKKSERLVEVVEAPTL